LATDQQPLPLNGSQDETICLSHVDMGECLQMFTPARLYDGMNITSVSGLNVTRKATLKRLSAIAQA